MGRVGRLRLRPTWLEARRSRRIEGVRKQGAQQWPPGNGFRCWHDRTGVGDGQEHLLMADSFLHVLHFSNVSNWHSEVVAFNFSSFIFRGIFKCRYAVLQCRQASMWSREASTQITV